MNGIFLMDDNSRVEPTPFNIRADFREVDRSFRERLETLVPSHLSKRVEEIINKRLKEKKNTDNKIV